MHATKAYLILADGTVFEGKSFGAPAEREGRVVFTTNMTGFQETLTDPGHIGHLVCQTFPLVGGPGMNAYDNESGHICAAGYIVREWCEHPSNFRCGGDVNRFLKDNRVPGIWGVDTRALTRHLRKHGAMAGALRQYMPADMEALKNELSQYDPRMVPIDNGGYPLVNPAEGERKYRVVLYDFGAKKSFVRALARRGCEVVQVFCDAPAAEALAGDVDGVVWAGSGPGPEQITLDRGNLKAVLTYKKPLLAVGLGHQLLALTMGGGVASLPFGHHGGQPVQDVSTKRTFPTAQNTDYTVQEASLPPKCVVTHRNMGDGAVEGLQYEGLPAVSTQFTPGEGDTAFVLDQFLVLMDGAG